MPKTNSQNDTDQDAPDILAAVRSVSDYPLLQEADTTRFVFAVKKGVENRAYRGWDSEKGSSKNCAVFVHVKVPRRPSVEIVETCELKNIRDLAIAGQPIFGRIFFLDRDATNGSYIDLPVAPDDLDVWLMDMGLMEAPIATVYRNQLSMSFWSRQLNSGVRHFKIRDKEPTLDIPELILALDNFHEFHVLTPTACSTDIWQTGLSDQYIPGNNAEKKIQKSMRTALQSWFHGMVTVDLEDRTDIGRIDVRLLLNSDDPHSGKTYWSIIELKVVRSFGNHTDATLAGKIYESTHIKDIEEGFSQADNFSINREVPEGFLEIFDMRKIKTPLLADPKVLEAINRCSAKVNYFLRPMYGSASEARIAGYENAC